MGTYEALLGPVSEKVDATAQILEFFQAHARS
jgi:poly(3-hydroxybutyrate) depolymerase